jgi:hypothetical protein
LIDAGDGLAEKTAARLRAGGFSRVVILAGGETIIRRKGQAGLLRKGSGAGLISERQAQPSLATVVEEDQ